MSERLAIIILAAGKSTRMKSEVPKVLHPLCGRPMLGYVLDLVKELSAQKTIAVLGYKHEEVRKILPPGIKAVVQKRLLGTADAVKCALPILRGFSGTVLILYGDTPLLKADTVKKLLTYHRQNNAAATLLGAHLEKPASYGRIVRDKFFSICGIVEAKDADDAQGQIKEINTGIVCFDKKALGEALSRIKANNRKKEYYLTDAIGILYKKGRLIDGVNLQDINESLGINARIDLAQAAAVMQQRINEEFMKKGVTIVDPRSTFISYGARIGQDTTIYPFTVIESGVIIGKRCSVGPFARLREGTCLKDDCLVGNFLEIVRSKISQKTLVKHFGYLGDSRIGRRVNIGAGAVITGTTTKR